MDIICGKCGKHFNSVEAARGHSGHCTETSNSEPIHWVPSRNSKISPREWENMVNLINTPYGYANKNGASDKRKSVELTQTKESCPNCKKNLYYDSELSVWKCKECKRVYTYHDLHNKQVTAREETSRQKEKISSITEIKQEENTTEKSTEKTRRNSVNKKTTINSIPKWLIALLLVFTFGIIGLGVSLLVGSSIPLWLLFGFSFVYSVGKWFDYITRKYKVIGKLYRLLLNLSILAVLGLLIWSGIQLFSQQFFQSSIIGSVIFIAEFVFFIWIWRVVAKNNWRWPSMKLTIFSLIVLFFVFAFAGVQPIKSYKDTAFTNIASWWESSKNAVNDVTKTSPATPLASTVTSPSTSPTSTITSPSQTTSSLIDKVSDFAIRFNEYRQSKGRASLIFTDDLNRIAALRLEEIKNNFSHYSKGGYNNHLAENIAMSTGALSNQGVLGMWQGSPGHNANMLDMSYKYTGYAIGGGYAIQVFTEWETINGEPQLPPGWYFTD